MSDKGNHPQDRQLTVRSSCLALSTIGFEALQPLVLVLAYQLGSTRLVNGHNPINFCNGLLFGNAFSLVALLMARSWSQRRSQRKDTDGQGWSGHLALKALPPIVCNALLEVGLVIAFSRIHAIQVTITVASTAIALMLWDWVAQRNIPKPLPLLGAALIVCSAVIALQPDQDVKTSEGLVAIGASLIPNSSIGNACLLAGILGLSVLYFKLSESVVQDMGVFSFAIWQTMVQTLIFLVWATTTFGLSHLYDLQSPLLWQVMLLYGCVISSAYTLVEAAALSEGGGLLISLFEGFLPIASGLIAWLLLREQLTANLLLSSLIAGTGIVIIEASKQGMERLRSTRVPASRPIR